MVSGRTLLAAGLALSAALAAAQGTGRIIVPYPPGGSIGAAALKGAQADGPLPSVRAKRHAQIMTSAHVEHCRDYFVRACLTSSSSAS
jgi:hypothetical protein